MQEILIGYSFVLGALLYFVSSSDIIIVVRLVMVRCSWFVMLFFVFVYVVVVVRYCVGIFF